MYAIAKKKDKWMQKAVPKKNKGLLHKRLNIPEDKEIPSSLIQSKLSALRKKKKPLSESDSKFMKQLNFALNAKKVSKKKKADVVQYLVKAANTLDKMGLYAEAEFTDEVIRILVADGDPGQTNFGNNPDSQNANPVLDGGGQENQPNPNGQQVAKPPSPAEGGTGKKCSQCQAENDENATECKQCHKKFQEDTGTKSETTQSESPQGGVASTAYPAPAPPSAPGAMGPQT